MVQIHRTDLKKIRLRFTFPNEIAYRGNKHSEQCKMIKNIRKKNRIARIVSFQTSLRRSLYPRHHTSRPSFQMSDVESRISDVRSRMSDVGCRMSDLGCRMSDARSRMSDVESRMSDVGCRIWDARFRMSNVGCGMWDVECGMSDVEYRISDVECRMSDVEPRTSDVGCWMSDGTYKLPYDCTKYPKTMTAHKTEILNMLPYCKNSVF